MAGQWVIIENHLEEDLLIYSSILLMLLLLLLMLLLLLQGTASDAFADVVDSPD